jgi:hypothetical protein
MFDAYVTLPFKPKWLWRVFLPIVRRAVWASRLQGLAVLALCAVLSFGQGQELALSLQIQEVASIAVGLSAVLILAVMIWIWTGVSIMAAPATKHFGAAGESNSRKLKRRMHYVLPMLLSVTLQLFVAFELHQIGEKGAALALASLNVVILVLLIQLLGFKSTFKPSQAARPHDSTTSSASTKQIAFTLISSAALAILWTIWKVPGTQALGAFGATFLAIAIALPWLSLVAHMARFRKIPIVTMILLAPFAAETVYGFLGIKFDRYAVRTIVDERSGAVVKPDDRMTVPVAAAKWRTQADKLGTNTPIVFVTAAGGGIRAAYWTAAVLGRLMDCVPNFTEKVFSISGVSGGSLGAAAFVTWVDQPTRAKPIPCTHDLPWDTAAVGRGPNQTFLRDALSDDFLAPVIREMILGDGVRALLPFKFSNMDRAIALEEAWEVAWEKACQKALRTSACVARSSLEASFTRRDKNAPLLPALVLNGVHQETGKRLVTSTIQFETGDLVDTIDFFKLVNHDIRISTSVLNSARFPIVSPSGALVRYSNDQTSAPGRPTAATMRVGHVIDGGYFDNNGTLTSHEIAAAVLPLVGNVGSPPACSGGNFRRVVFLEILNDNSMPEHDMLRSSEDFKSLSIESDAVALGRFDANLPARQLATAIQGLEATRSARAVHASKWLAKFSETDTCSKRFVQLNLCPGMIPNPPLGWTLSRESRDAIDSLILGHGSRIDRYRSSKSSRVRDCYEGLQSQLNQLIQFLQ